MKYLCRQIWSNIFDIVLVLLITPAVLKTFVISLRLSRICRRGNYIFSNFCYFQVYGFLVSFVVHGQ